MKPEYQQVVNTCIELQNLGKKPSVGMIKAKLLSPLPIPIIIKGLSYWKEYKHTLKIDALPQLAVPIVSTHDVLGERVTQLESDLVLLRSELKALQRRLEDEGP
ncbi:MAG: hypothetical protein ACI97K_001687 [Glaciecola sp.]|jgi:hypothetical protein